MGIQLISETEKLVKKISGCEFYYRRVPADKVQEIVDQNTDRGEVDYASVAMECMQYAMLGWGGDVPTLNGNSMDYKPEYLKLLEPDVLKELNDAISGGGKKTGRRFPLSI